MYLLHLSLTVVKCLILTQDPGTAPARRIWTSIDVGTEIFVSDKDEVAEWTLSDFDVLLTSKDSSYEPRMYLWAAVSSFTL